MAWSRDPKLYVTHHAGVPLIMYRNSNGVHQIVIPKSGGFCKLLIEELHVTTLASHLGIQKLTHTLFQGFGGPSCIRQ